MRVEKKFIKLTEPKEEESVESKSILPVLSNKRPAKGNLASISGRRAIKVKDGIEIWLKVKCDNCDNEFETQNPCQSVCPQCGHKPDCSNITVLERIERPVSGN